MSAVAGCSSVDAQTHAFATLAEAREAGAIARGWIPDGLPSGTHDLRIAYVPDRPQRWAIINFPPAEGDTLKALLGEEISLQDRECDVPTRIEWWPLLLRGTLDAERIQAAGLRAYRARQGNDVFAVNWRQGRAYFWIPPRPSEP